MELIASASDATAHIPGIEEKVTFLGQPDNFPEKPHTVEIIETHMAWVFLTHCRAWKLKKPVRYPYLDFSTMEARLEDCRLEVFLNRRLASDVYLGVRPLLRNAEGTLSLNQGRGRPIDWLVEMRRLPERWALRSKIANGEVDEGDCRKLGNLLGDFFRRCESVSFTSDNFRQRLRSTVLANGEELMRPEFELPWEQVREVTEMLLDLLRRHVGWLNRRIRENRIVDGHGDLRPEHVWLEEPPVVIDCIEFNRDFRIQDAAMDLALLLLECRRLGSACAAKAIERGYREESSDEIPEGLLDFYQGLQAITRTKIALWHLDDREVTGKDVWKSKAKSYLDFASSLLNCA